MAEAVVDNVPAKTDGKPPLFGLSFLENLSEMTMLRQVGLMVGLAASVAIGFAVVLWSQQPDYRPLYGSLAGMDSKQIMETLAAADIGIAMGGGTDVAMHAAGITLMRGDPRLVPAALEISRKTYAKIRQNLFWAFVYNLIGIPLAAFGLLNPVLAGAAMALSSVSVVSNALLLKTWKPKDLEDPHP